jgi:DNA polymerase-4
MERRIGCYTLPNLEIALARLSDPVLRRRPTAVAANGSRNAVVWQVSSEAREHGIGPGMSLSFARRLCPELKTIPPDSRRLAQAHRLLQEVFQQCSPLHELAAQDQFYIDLTAAARAFTHAATLARRIQSDIATRHGLHGVIGVSINKLLAHVAADMADAGPIHAVAPGEEQSFLAPLPVTSLPGLARLFAPRTNETLAVLEELCLKRIGQFAALPLDRLQLVIGGKARLLKQWSLGIDPSPVWPHFSAPVLDCWMCMPTAAVDTDVLLPVLYSAAEQICSSLRRQNRASKRMRLVLQYRDGYEIIKTLRFDPATRWESEVYPAVEERFLSVDRRVGMRAIGLMVECAAAIEQLELFTGAQTDRPRKLAAAVDAIRNRYGAQTIARGTIAAN